MELALFKHSVIEELDCHEMESISRSDELSLRGAKRRSEFVYGRRKASPNSEKIESSVAMPQKGNFSSVEQIQGSNPENIEVIYG